MAAAGGLWFRLFEVGYEIIDDIKEYHAGLLRLADIVHSIPETVVGYLDLGEFLPAPGGIRGAAAVGAVDLEAFVDDLLLVARRAQGGLHRLLYSQDDDREQIPVRVDHEFRQDTETIFAKAVRCMDVAYDCIGQTPYLDLCVQYLITDTLDDVHGDDELMELLTSRIPEHVEIVRYLAREADEAWWGVVEDILFAIFDEEPQVQAFFGGDDG